MRFAGERIWIIGASSGIGRALARELAVEGARLVLSGRCIDRLRLVDEELGGRHLVVGLDVSDSEAVVRAVDEIVGDMGRLDRVVFLAAVYRPSRIESNDSAFARQSVEVNLLGAMYVVYALMPVFARQRGGQIALCASVAGYTGLPGGQPYSATKAGLINFAESLHAEADDDLDIKLINPGFVRTRLTDRNEFPMPMRIEPEQAARFISRGLKKRAFEIHFPRCFTMAVGFLGILPYFFRLRLIRGLVGGRGV